MSHKGFFSIQDKFDLREKARRDLARLVDAPTNEDVAFNFFITARHVPDWIDAAAAAAAFATHVELRICRHIADGAKHFQATRKSHTQVVDLIHDAGAFDAGAFDSRAFDVDQLIVELSSQDATDSGLPREVDIVTLASRVMQVLDGLF